MIKMLRQVRYQQQFSKLNIMKQTLIIIKVISFIFLGLSFAVYFAFASKFIYHLDYYFLNIGTNSGISKEIAFKNMDNLIWYLQPWVFSKLKYYNIYYSEQGTSHFKDVKDLLNLFYILGAVGIVGLVSSVLYEKRKNKEVNTKFIKYSIFILVSIMIFIALAILYFGFDEVFEIFHQIFFRNKDYAFDPSTDQIIMLLPAEFFMHMMIVLFAYLVIYFVISYLLVYLIKKHKNKKSK